MTKTTDKAWGMRAKAAAALPSPEHGSGAGDSTVKNACFSISLTVRLLLR